MISSHSSHNLHLLFCCALILFTNPSTRTGYDTRSIFKRSLTGLNSKFSFSKTSCLTKTEEHSLSYCLPITGGRIIGFIPFPRVLVLCEMQPFLYRIWTQVAVSISYDDNHYTTGTSTMLCINDFCFDIIGPYGIFCTAIRRDSVSLLRLSFHSHV